MPPSQFITKRLSVRDWRPSLRDMGARRNLEAALSAVLTPAVLEHLPPPLQLGPDGADISEWIDARARESDVLLVNWKDSGGPIGLMLVAPDTSDPETPAFHIGYLLAETTWGQGVATELLTGFVSAAKTTGPSRLLGGVGRSNPASARVLQKAGFEIDPDLSTENTEIYVRHIA